MWLQIGLASGAVVVMLALAKRMFRRRGNVIDVGPVSEAWLAEQRNRRDQSF